MVQDLKAFMEKIREDPALRERMDKIVRESTYEKVFDNCNAVATEMGYNITQEDLQAYADEYQEDLNDEELDKVAGGTTPISIISIFVSVPAMSYSLSKLDKLLRGK